eukprot:3276980-Rhodomonas_salina.2
MVDVVSDPNWNNRRGPGGVEALARTVGLCDPPSPGPHCHWPAKAEKGSVTTVTVSQASPIRGLISITNTMIMSPLRLQAYRRLS